MNILELACGPNGGTMYSNGVEYVSPQCTNTIIEYSMPLWLMIYVSVSLCILVIIITRHIAEKI